MINSVAYALVLEPHIVVRLYSVYRKVNGSLPTGWQPCLVGPPNGFLLPNEPPSMDPYDIVLLCLGSQESTMFVICKLKNKNGQLIEIIGDSYGWNQFHRTISYLYYITKNSDIDKYINKTVSNSDGKGLLFRCIRVVNLVLFGIRRLCKLLWLTVSACQTAFSISTCDSVKEVIYICDPI